MKMKIFVFTMEVFQFFEFLENETKHEKWKFKRGLTVTFEVKSFNNSSKNRLTILQPYFFLWLYSQIIQVSLNTSKITKLKKVSNSGKVCSFTNENHISTRIAWMLLYASN